MKAILNNDDKLIYDIFKYANNIDADAVDNYGKTPIHYVVNSHKNGSYENIKLLKFLAKHYDVNRKDYKFMPIHYAVQQDS